MLVPALTNCDMSGSITASFESVLQKRITASPKQAVRSSKSYLDLPGAPSFSRSPLFIGAWTFFRHSDLDIRHLFLGDRLIQIQQHPRHHRVGTEFAGRRPFRQILDRSALAGG